MSLEESRSLREYEAAQRNPDAYHCAWCGEPQPVPSLARDCENRHLAEIPQARAGAAVAP